MVTPNEQTQSSSIEIGSNSKGEAQVKAKLYTQDGEEVTAIEDMPEKVVAAYKQTVESLERQGFKVAGRAN